MLMIFISFFSDENDDEHRRRYCCYYWKKETKTYNRKNEVIRGRRHGSPVQAHADTFVADRNWSSNSAENRGRSIFHIPRFRLHAVYDSIIYRLYVVEVCSLLGPI